MKSLPKYGNGRAKRSEKKTRIYLPKRKAMMAELDVKNMVNRRAKNEKKCSKRKKERLKANGT